MANFLLQEQFFLFALELVAQLQEHIKIRILPYFLMVAMLFVIIIALGI